MARNIFWHTYWAHGIPTTSLLTGEVSYVVPSAFVLFVFYAPHLLNLWAPLTRVHPPLSPHTASSRACSTLLPLRNKEAQRRSHPRKSWGHPFPPLCLALTEQEFICHKHSSGQKLLHVQVCWQSSWTDLSLTCSSEPSSLVKICYSFC